MFGVRVWFPGPFFPHDPEQVGVSSRRWQETNQVHMNEVETIFRDSELAEWGFDKRMDF